MTRTPILVRRGLVRVLPVPGDDRWIVVRVKRVQLARWQRVERWRRARTRRARRQGRAA